MPELFELVVTLLRKTAIIGQLCCAFLIYCLEGCWFPAYMQSMDSQILRGRTTYSRRCFRCIATVTLSSMLISLTYALFGFQPTPLATKLAESVQQ